MAGNSGVDRFHRSLYQRFIVFHGTVWLGILDLTGFTGLCSKRFNVFYGIVWLGILDLTGFTVSVPKG